MTDYVHGVIVCAIVRLLVDMAVAIWRLSK
jgi:hypothetical protein